MYLTKWWGASFLLKIIDIISDRKTGDKNEINKSVVGFVGLTDLACTLNGCAGFNNFMNSLNAAADERNKQQAEIDSKATVEIYPNEMSEINTRKTRADNYVEVNKTLMLVFVPHVAGPHTPSWHRMVKIFVLFLQPQSQPGLANIQPWL